MAERPQDKDRNQEATVYLGNLDERCTDALMWELMLQAGPVSNVHLPKDRVSQSHQGFGFCEFMTEEDAEYACKIMNQIKLFGKPIRVNKASYDKKQLDVGANLFIGNLDVMVDETLLYNTFSAFGQVAQAAKIARDPMTGEAKGYGFISYNDFESSDAALESMDGQYLMNKPITVQYAFKKDGKGERHGTPAERLLAAQAKKHALLPGMGTGANGFMPQGQYAGGMPPPPMPAGFSAAPGMPGMPAGYPPATPQQYGQPPPPPAGFAPPPQGYPQQFGQPPPQQQQQQYGQLPMMGGYPQMPQMGMPGMNGVPPPPPPGFMTGANSMPVPGR